MSSILQKAKLAQKSKKPATNLIDLNKQEVIEDKIAGTEKPAAKKVEEDWSNDHHDVIDISHVKTEKKAEEVKPEEIVIQQKVSDTTVTWGYTKEIDEQEALRVAANQAVKKEEEVPAGKKIMKSWVPQALKEEGGSMQATFVAEEEYFPEIGQDIVNMKPEKPKPTTISRASADAPSAGNPFKFASSNTGKGGFKPLEMSEQEKRLQEIEEKNRKEYSRQEGGFRPPQQDQTAEIFSSSTQPPRFSNQKAGQIGGNFAALQKSEIDLKQEEAMRRVEERLKATAAEQAQQNTTTNTAFAEGSFRRAPVPEPVSQPAADSTMQRPRFMNTKVEKIDNSTPLQQTSNAAEAPKPAEEQQQVAQTQVQQAEEAASKPAPRFMNASKQTQGPNFKPIEIKEVNTVDKKYLSKKQEQTQNQEKTQQVQNDESEDEVDENGFVVVKDKKHSSNNRRNRGGESRASDKKKQDKLVSDA